MEFQRVAATIEAEFEKYVDFLCEICAYEARAKHKQTIDQMVDRIAAFAAEEGFCVERIPFENCGDFLCIEVNVGGEKGCGFLAHMDTVHEKGVFGEQPVKRLEGRIVGPGVIDCKGGIAIAMLAMKALVKNGCTKHLRLLLTSDEEISNTLGGDREKALIVEKMTGFPYVLNCETAEGDRVVIARKGIIKCRIEIQGISGHSGIHYFDCSNPIEEAAHKILALQSKSKPGGITYSCNIVHGGAVENIIPETCSVSVDVRFPRHCDADEVEQTLRSVTEHCTVKGTSAQAHFISKRIPMEKNPDTMALLDKLLGLCEKYQLGTLTPVESGGGSDSCYTQAAGIPTICGIGACGGFPHTNQEYVETESISLRAKILAALVLEG